MKIERDLSPIFLYIINLVFGVDDFLWSLRQK